MEHTAAIRPGSNDQPQRAGCNDQKQIKSKRESCFNCGVKPSHPKGVCPAKKVKCFKCGKEGHYIPCADQRVKMHVSMSYKSSHHHFIIPVCNSS